MNWKPAILAQAPEFKKIVLGLQVPNKVSLVYLDRIDESGLVFLDTSPSINNIFGIKSPVKIDFYCEIELLVDQVNPET